ncbi:hypothetical protein VQ643_09490 [Pseudomonas sp. F1_0610]|uniref:hypothetical protein n=1 Tax=Pseudomonas sp. F1_0610 TaxID=3114284 RepID=UPI0039C4AD28
MNEDKQSSFLQQLADKLKEVPLFGGSIQEGYVPHVVDSEDESLPAQFIILQPGETEEKERMHNSVIEAHTVLITLVTKDRNAAAQLRQARLEVKRCLAGKWANLQGTQKVYFKTENPMPAQAGYVFSLHVMPLYIEYVQPI